MSNRTFTIEEFQTLPVLDETVMKEGGPFLPNSDVFTNQKKDLKVGQKVVFLNRKFGQLIDGVPTTVSEIEIGDIID